MKFWITTEYLKSAKWVNKRLMKKHIPNFLTALNLFSGILAIVAAFNLQVIWIAIFLAFSLVFDFLDGLTARLLNARSELGKQLDSLADMISFGFAPGVIMFFLLKASSGLPDIYIQEINIIPYFGFFITIFSALRLAKFNIDTQQEDSFIGLPTPANTILILSVALISNYLLSDSGFFAELTNKTWFLLSLTLLSCYLLVAKIPLLAFKFKTLGWNKNKAQYSMVLLTIILISLFKIAAVPIIILLYIIISMLFREKA